jgi:hypothetical protein
LYDAAPIIPDVSESNISYFWFAWNSSGKILIILPVHQVHIRSLIKSLKRKVSDTNSLEPVSATVKKERPTYNTGSQDTFF